MKISYGSNKLKKKMSSASEISKGFGTMAKKVQQRLDEIESSPNLSVLMQIPAANCHPLSGNRSGEWALNISGNYRLIFTIDHDPIPITETGEIDRIEITDIRIIEATDYH
jgi:plasmid maintenance system killer protein